MQHRVLRLSSPGHTWIGRAIAPEHDVADEEDRTVRGVFLGPDAEEERTERGLIVDRAGDEDRTEPSAASRYVGAETDSVVFTADMVAELRRRLRDAEAREASGVRLRPIVEDGAAHDESADMLDALADLDIDAEEPRSIDALEAVSPVPTVEVALAPHSDSNFYAGFDDEHPDGVFVATYSRLPVGAPVYLDVHLPAGFGFRAAALVEWVRPPEAAAPGLPAGIGLQMCGLDDSTRRLIRSFVRQRKPLFYLG